MEIEIPYSVYIDLLYVAVVIMASTTIPLYFLFRIYLFLLDKLENREKQ